MTKRINLSEVEIKILRRQYQDLSEEEFGGFLAAAERYGLNPLANQIYVQLRNKNEPGKRAVAYTAQIDGYRLIADRTSQYCGNDDPVYDDEKVPKKATVTVYKLVGGTRCPYTASARWDQYLPKFENQQFMWKRMPHLMLGKCAEALALRKAFPAELAGLYTVEEMEQDQAPAIPGGNIQSRPPESDGPPQAPPLPECPKCKTAKNTIKGRPQYGGGLVCYKKNGGCGEKWATADHPFTGKAKDKADAEAAKKPLATEAPPASGSQPENPKDMVSKKCQILAYVHAMKNISETEPVRLRANALMNEGKLTVAERAEIEQAVIDALGRLASAKVGLPLTATKYEPPPTTPRSPDEPW